MSDLGGIEDKMNQKKISGLIVDFEKRNPTIYPDKEFKYVEIGSISQDKKIVNFKAPFR